MVETDYKLKYKLLKYRVKLTAAQKKKDAENKKVNSKSGLPPCNDNRICVEGEYGKYDCFNQGWFGRNIECDDGDD